MKAVRIHSFGDPETLRLEEVEAPKPKAGEHPRGKIAFSID